MLTKQVNCSVNFPSTTLTAPTSIISSCSTESPVVSKSKQIYVRNIAYTSLDGQSALNVHCSHFGLLAVQTVLPNVII